MKYLILLTLVWALSLKAETVPLPTSVLGVDDLVQELKGSFTTKISDLGKNYITHITDQIVTFTNSETMICNNVSHVVGEPLAKMQYSFQKNNLEFIEKAIYTGCNGETALVEDVVTKGTAPLPLPAKDFLAGKRSIDLKDNETYRLYRISNAASEEIFKVLIEGTNVGKTANFFILGQKFMSMVYEYQATLTRLTITYYGYNASYKVRNSGWTLNRNFQPYTNVVVAYKGIEDQVVYLDADNNRLSLANFLTWFNEGAIRPTISVLAKIIEFHTNFFPKTKTTQTGAQSQRLLEELRIAQNRLLNNTELNLVRNLLQEYMNAAEKGLIIDNRPKK